MGKIMIEKKIFRVGNGLSKNNRMWIYIASYILRKLSKRISQRKYFRGNTKSGRNKNR
ncbi:hypothetical protein KSU1_C1525 [Candidatus Jettenia caeni]|uniref:Uncharacterized protein n=1 Tax=Candidatus Jettenia caeni TaxID=247490 RepID=I3IN26_9BACT|nr:hypothetical protein KSU1_C0583 [Candidatus Jettenia caeni]GAB63121.1 hypothetical protein KSU1_C1525 [Candidatus Jettenia caeni]